MDIYFNCAQPTYEDLELAGEWMVDDTTMVESPPAERPAPGTPAPRLFVPLFPNRRRRRVRSAKEVAAGSCPQPSTKKYLSPDVWRYGVMYFCDVSTLLQLHATCRQLRAQIEEVQFVVDWQDQAWYLKKRGCKCERNLFYLNVSQFLEFAWDCLEIPNSRQSDVALRACGRCVNMDLAPRIPLPYLDPRNSPRCFLPGLLDIWYENWIVPMPRMTFVRVEDCGVHMPREEHSPFWLDHHPVPEEDPEEGDTPEQRAITEVPPTHFHVLGPDLVEAYEADCAAVHRDPYDPAQDNADCLGYTAVCWARRRMYESAVGIQTYPLHLCLRRSELTGRAYRSGMAHMETLFLPVQRPLVPRTSDPVEGTQILPHNGTIYFHPVRYNNEAGDFVPWALSMLAVQQGLYRHAWFDGCHHIIQRMCEFARETAAEVQSDMPMPRMAERWNHLYRRMFLGETLFPLGGGEEDPLVQTMNSWVHPPNSAAAAPQTETQPQQPETRAQRRARQDQWALHLMFNSHYAPYNMVMGRLAERETAYWDSHGAAWHHPGHYPYLMELLGDTSRMFAGHRTEAMLVAELRELIRVTDYIVRFALTVGPLTDPITELRRYRCLNAYLGAATSLIMFAPSFRRVPSWDRTDTRQRMRSFEVPYLSLQNNHRFRRYLRFLNRRTLYYVPDPTYPPDAYRSEINPRA